MQRIEHLKDDPRFYCRRPLSHEGPHSPWPLVGDENCTGPTHAVRKPEPIPEDIKEAIADIGSKLAEALAPIFEALGAFATDLAEKLKAVEDKDDYEPRDDDK